MFKIKGLDKMAAQLKEAEAALKTIDGDLGSVSFDPEDPQSIEMAIVEMERMIEDRVGQYANNPVIGPMIPQMKEQYRQAILDKAAEARVGSDDSEA